MDEFQTVGSAEALKAELDIAEYAPDDVTIEMCERLLALAAERTQMRGENAVDPSRQKDFLFTSDWQNMVQEKLGDHSGRANQFALGTIDFETSEGRDAYLVKNAVVPQWQWLETGDGRMHDVVPVDLTDTDYHDEPRVMWWPRNYTAVIEFEDSVVKGQAKLADVM